MLEIELAAGTIAHPRRPRRGAAAVSLRPAAQAADSYTLIPEDQPAVLAAHIREFLAE